ncbi:AAA family ATPase [Singulisphaera sp. Ch08]|uniref:AAA family ATPase n=1 Tax=Singulisphaera sp. Ch08 TaxID=3120278 RepID=A0AAU7CDA7_9BACT
MKLTDLIVALSDPSAYPHSVDDVEVHQTHISVVFLAGAYAYKIKKPLDLGFLDYGTLERRLQSCEQEVVLNHRLAPTVYLGVVPVARHGKAVKMDGPGEVIEWAVKMTRLPEEATLRERLRREKVGVEQVEALAARVAMFHADAEASPRISAAGRFDVVARNARENFEQAASHVGTTVSQSVFERLRHLTEAALTHHRLEIEERAAQGVPRDTHGDLRLDHVYLFPDRPPPDDLVIVDCIEFNERFRFADPVADMAFLAMDFVRHGRRDLERAFADAYFHASCDEDGRSLLHFYAAYRAAVRGKVEGLTSREPEVPAAERTKSVSRARAHWLLALGELEEPGRRPCLVLVGGLPGTGKSTLARALDEEHEFTLIRSDLVRKELARLTAREATTTSYGTGIYSSEWNDRTYAECLKRAEALLFEGKRVVVDASFGTEANRVAFLEAATHWGVPAAFLCCQAEPAVVRGRLESRKHDASDADWSIYLEAAARWEAPGTVTTRSLCEIDAGGAKERVHARATTILRDLGLED